MNGIINFYKPKGITSHGAVNFFRKLTGIKRIGHTGTLDPNAEGILPICIGKATRVSEYLLSADKAYMGELILGQATDTQDKDGKVINTSSKTVSEEDIRNSFSKFKGEILQIPPMYSALKHKGKKLYDLAREGKTVERTPRNINIYDLEIKEITNNRKVSFYVKSSRGTYIRTLSHDIGEDLGTFAYMSKLTRVEVGPFSMKNSYRKDELEDLGKDEIKELLLPIDYALMQFEKINMPSEFYKNLKNGMKIKVERNQYNLDELYRVYSNNVFIGLGEIIEKDEIHLLKMNKVFV